MLIRQQSCPKAYSTRNLKMLRSSEACEAGSKSWRLKDSHRLGMLGCLDGLQGQRSLKDEDSPGLERSQDALKTCKAAQSLQGRDSQQWMLCASWLAELTPATWLPYGNGIWQERWAIFWRLLEELFLEATTKIVQGPQRKRVWLQIFTFQDLVPRIITVTYKGGGMIINIHYPPNSRK